MKTLKKMQIKIKNRGKKKSNKIKKKNLKLKNLKNKAQVNVLIYNI